MAYYIIFTDIFPVFISQKAKKTEKTTKLKPETEKNLDSGTYYVPLYYYPGLVMVWVEKESYLMELPNEDTLKIIEERKKYLVQKSEKTPTKNGYELQEIKALEKIINLIKIFQNNLFYDFKKEIAENISNENINEEELDNDKNYKTLHSYEQKMTKNSKLDVKFIEMKSNSKKYIILALKVYKEKLLKWVYQGKIEFTPMILEEILNKLNEMEKNSSM